MKDFHMPSHYFLHITSGRSWPTDDPHQWLLDRRDDDLLAPARERLMASPEEPDRCIRVALRRCSMALVQVVNNEHLVVRHWSAPAPDLRTWANEVGWNRPGLGVMLVNVKSGAAVVHEDGGDVLIHGEQVGEEFPWAVYTEKYERRHGEEQDDSEAAPASFTNFVWAGSPADRIGWQVLKSIWNAERVSCPNCDVPLVVVAFEWRMGLLSFRSARIVRVCLHCRRRFEFSEEKPLSWLGKVLPPLLRPTHLQLWQPIPIDWLELSLGRGRVAQVAGREE